MVKKLCPSCKKTSYSARTKGEWICPTCGFDLTEVEVRTLELSDLNPEFVEELALKEGRKLRNPPIDFCRYKNKRNGGKFNAHRDSKSFC